MGLGDLRVAKVLADWVRRAASGSFDFAVLRMTDWGWVPWAVAVRVSVQGSGLRSLGLGLGVGVFWFWVHAFVAGDAGPV